MAKIARWYISISASEIEIECLFSREQDQLELQQYALHSEMMKMLTILKAFYSDDIFCKTLTDLDDEAIEDDIEVVIQRPDKRAWIYWILVYIILYS